MSATPDDQDDFTLSREQEQALIEHAVEFLREAPDAKPVGLVLLHDASEARPLREVLEKATGQSLAGRGFIGVVPRDMVLTILRTSAPETLEWLEDSPRDLYEPDGKLPIVIAAGRGYKLGTLSYRAVDG